ncbi:MAG: hypothetical protein ACYC0H_09405 [Solirubrobacteraceae bacterium]
MRTLVRGLAGIVVVAAVGFLWAHFGLTRTRASPPPLDRALSAPGLTIHYPSSWRRAAGGGPAVLPGALALASSQTDGARLEVATVGALRPLALPSSVQAALARVPQPQLVLLGGMNFRRYLDAPLTGGRGVASIYELPTTAGTVTAVCSSRAFSTSFTSTCERVLASARPSGTVLSLQVQGGYALALNRIMDTLDTVRGRAGPGLSATSPSARARAASELAAAHAAASRAAAQITRDGVPPTSVSAVNPLLVSALSRCGAAYAALAQAATSRDAAAYAAAEAKVAAGERLLTTAFAQLRAIGYHVA